MKKLLFLIKIIKFYTEQLEWEKFLKVSVCFVAIIFISIVCVFKVGAEPTIVTLSKVNDITDGSAILINGTDFGANKIEDIESLIDNIESGNAGSAFDKEKWTNHYNNKAVYTTDDKHSGTKSILFDFYDDVYGRAIYYDWGSQVEYVYFTAWVKIVRHDDAASFQWKNWKLKDLPGYTFQTTIYGENWWYSADSKLGSGSDGWGNTSCAVMRNSVTDQSSKKTVVADGFLIGEWQRLEARYKKSSATGVNDGLFEWRRIGRTEGEVIVSNYEIITHDSTNEDQLYQYLFVGHYYGNLKDANGDSYTGIRDAEIYYDDIYISQSQARIEIGNNETWENCTHREIQIPTAWTTDEITITVNQGSFSNEGAYIFVIDENGGVSAGYPVTFSESTAPTNIINTTNNQTVVDSSFTIQGTATATTGRTITGVTIPNETVTPDDGAWDEIEENWTCNVTLSDGLNSYIATATDSSAETGIAPTFNVTYTNNSTTSIGTTGTTSIGTTGTTSIR